MNNKPVPLSLRKKSSARLAAVQCLYKMKVTGETPSAEKLMNNYLDHWQDDHDGEDRAFSKDAEPDKSLLRKLLTASIDNASEVDGIIRNSMTEKWTMERTSPLLLAIITCALVEMRFIATLSAAIIIDEYVTITGRFFESAEMGFVNGLLDKLATTPPSAATN